MSSRAAPRWKSIACRTTSFASGETRIELDLRTGDATRAHRSPVGERTARRWPISPEQLQDLIEAVDELDLDPRREVRAGLAVPDEAQAELTLKGRWFRRRRCTFMADSGRDAWPGLRRTMDALHAATAVDWLETEYKVKRFGPAIRVRDGWAQYRAASDDEGKVVAFPIERNVAYSWVETLRVISGPVFVDIDGDGRAEALITTRHDAEKPAARPYFEVHVFALEARGARELDFLSLGNSSAFQASPGAIVLADGRQARWDLERRRLTTAR